MARPRFSMLVEHLRTMRRLTMGDDAALTDLDKDGQAPALDIRTRCLVVIGAHIGSGVPSLSGFRSAVASARAAGVADEAIVATVLAVAPMVGSIDIDSVIEVLDAAFEGAHGRGEA